MDTLILVLALCGIGDTRMVTVLASKLRAMAKGSDYARSQATGIDVEEIVGNRVSLTEEVEKALGISGMIFQIPEGRENDKNISKVLSAVFTSFDWYTEGGLAEMVATEKKCAAAYSAGAGAGNSAENPFSNAFERHAWEQGWAHHHLAGYIEHDRALCGGMEGEGGGFTTLTPNGRCVTWVPSAGTLMISVGENNPPSKTALPHLGAAFMALGLKVRQAW